jgi:phosphopantetheinyl transferase
VTPMILYVFDNYKGNRADEYNTNRLIGLALKQYTDDHGLAPLSSTDITTICRTSKGKPFIENLPIHFSVSHSEHQWVCLVGPNESGIDIQKNHHVNYEAISRRFYSQEEQQAVLKGGLDTFIALWCRKEAFIKYFGMTMGETMEWLNVARNGEPVNQIEHDGIIIKFTDLRVSHDYQCVAATRTKEQIWIKKLQID